MAAPVLPSARVVHEVLGVSADGEDDSNTNPDVTYLSGLKVTFTPSVQKLVYTGPEGAKTLIPASVTCVYDKNTGRLKLTETSTKDGIDLWATIADYTAPTGWTWTAKWSLASLPSVPFVLHPNETVDLSTIIPVPANPGSQLADWLAAVEAAQAAQTAAEAAALEAEAAALEATKAVDGVGTGIGTGVTEANLDAAVANYLIAKPPPAGDDGREVELQATATHVQWRYVGDAAWLDLIPLSVISGADGDDGLSVELQTTATHIQWRLVGGAWANLVSLSALVGPAGPPNVLTKGTVTTGAPGSEADFSITGTAPSQVLNLTIPTGATGAVSAWEYYAAGRPDIFGALDPAALAWRNAAPSGSTFYSTDGPQGAWVWRKRGASWVCVEGDTGWVKLTAATIVSAGVYVRRIGGVAFAYIGDGMYRIFTYVGTSGALASEVVPVAYRPVSTEFMTTRNDAGKAVSGLVEFQGQGTIVIRPSGASGNQTSETLSYPINPSVQWPTTLT